MIAENKEPRSDAIPSQKADIPIGFKEAHEVRVRVEHATSSVASPNGTTDHPIDPSAPFKQILSSEFETLPTEKKIQIVQATVGAFLDNPGLENELLECADVFLLAYPINVTAIETILAKNPVLLFKTLGQHPDLASAMCMYPKIHTLVQKTAFDLIRSDDLSDHARPALDFAFRYHEFSWTNSLVIVAAEKTPRLFLEFAKRSDWPYSEEYRSVCIQIANKNLAEANAGIPLNY